MALKHVEIKRRDLPLEVSKAVDALLKKRRERVRIKGLGEWLAVTGGAVGVLRELEKMRGPPEAIFARVLAHGLAGVAAGGAITYKLGSPAVRRATENVAEVIGKHGLFRDEQTAAAYSNRFPKLGPVSETHPFFIVSKKGSIVLLPNTAFQRAVAKAQDTFLKELIPGRFRRIHKRFSLFHP